MTSNLILWAQPLDNTSPDHIESPGEVVSSERPERRERAVSTVYSVATAGKRIFSKGGVQLTDDGRRFLVEVLSDQRDQAGRAAPIVCCGKYDPSFDDGSGAKVVININEFAQRIGRTITPEKLDLMKQAFVLLKKKRQRKRLVGILGFLALALALMALFYLVVWRRL